LDAPIATVKGNEVYEGRGGWLAEPIATLKPTEEGWEVYEGRPGWFDEPIATVEGGGRIAAACATVYLLLMGKHADIQPTLRNGNVIKAKNTWRQE
jgi:hypothetical protein